MRFRLSVALAAILFPASLCLSQPAPSAPPADGAEATAPIGNGTLSAPEMLKQTRDQVDAMAARLAKGEGKDDEWLLLARSYISLGEFKKAEDAARHLIALHPKEIPPRMMLAEAQMSGVPHGQGLPADFVATMREILTIDAKNPGGLYFVGLAEEQAGHPDQARKRWTTLLGALPKDDPRRAEVVHRLDLLPKK
jgi:cytochrome c-type biogenesis protein CcmH